MEEQELKNIYNEYFKASLKDSKEYKELFDSSVDEQKIFVSKLSKEDKETFDKIIESFIIAEDRMLEDTFVNAVKYAFKVFKELK